jgi:hypothetical protein
VLLVAVLCLCSGAAGLSAQQFKVSQAADLTFGGVLPNVPLTIQPSDAGSGRYIITGPKNKTVRLVFTLPSSMAGTSSMPISFGPLSAGYSQSSSGTNMQLFDPRRPPTVTLNDSGTGYVFIGGTVQPASGQSPGPYTAAILLVVSAP